MAENQNNRQDRGMDTEATVLKSEEEIKDQNKKSDVPYLIVAQGPKKGVRFPLNEGDNVIGRAIGSEVLLEDQSVSRSHAIITRDPEGFTVEDRDSKNGTFVNGKQITERVTIGHGDVIQLGVYSLRLITKEVSREEEVKPLPPDWEGKTVMMGAPGPEEDTSTMAEESKEEEAGEEGHDEEEMTPVDKTEESEEEPQEEKEEKALTVPEEKKKRRSLLWRLLMIIILILLLGGGGTYAYLKFFHKTTKEETKPERDVVKEKPLKEGTKEDVPPKGTTKEEKRELPSKISVFLDFASSPLPAEVFFKDKNYGTTPLKADVKLEVDKTYSAKGVFDLEEIGVKYEENVTFTVDRDEPLIPILFRGPIGILKIVEIPRNTEVYLEGYFVYDPFNAKTAKLDNVVFGKPIYIPYGKYLLELRSPKELAGSGEYVADIRYKREILITENSPVYELKVMKEDLNQFPAEILSVPTGADVFVDAKKVGETPYTGIFPLGEHTLSLRKEGYFEHKQEINMDINVPFRTEITLRTTVAGENINRGKVLMQKGQYKEAISTMTEVFKKSPTPGEIAQARYLIGSAFVHLGDYSTAESYFKQVLEDDDMKYPAMLGLVSVYHGLNQWDKAIPYLVDVFINAKDETIVTEAKRLFQQISPLKSIMYILTDPEGAKVTLNDQPVEELTPLILPDLSLGSYHIKIIKEGYQTQELDINMSVNEFNPVIVKLKPLED